MKNKIKILFSTLAILIGFLVLVQCKKNGNTFEKKGVNSGIIKGKVYTTAHKSALKLSLTSEIAFLEFKQPLETDIDIVVSPNKEFQEFVGIGAALTDAAAETFYKLSEKNQELFLAAYFDQEKGIGYSLARTIIHSCDFSTESYTYVEEGDTDLKTFSIAHDRKYRIPFTKRALKAAGGNLTMYASPWSPSIYENEQQHAKRREAKKRVLSTLGKLLFKIYKGL